LRFQGIDFLSFTFEDADLYDKTYRLSVKEIWNGEIKSDSSIFDSSVFGIEHLQTIQDTTFTLTVVGTHHQVSEEIEIGFYFPAFQLTRKFSATDSDAYSLRNLADSFRSEIVYGESFYLMAYILPYRKNGFSFYCAVESSGKDVSTWGEEYNIEHYMVFELKFE
jgi:hypothetical protein